MTISARLLTWARFHWASRGLPSYTDNETTTRRPSVHLMVKSNKNLLSVIRKIEGPEIPSENPALSSSVRLCKEQVYLPILNILVPHTGHTP
jgi:hypothetical protein